MPDMTIPIVTSISTDDFWSMHKIAGFELYDGGTFKTLDGRTIRLCKLSPLAQAKVAILECGLMLNESGGNTGIYILDTGVKDVNSATHKKKVIDFVTKEIIRNGKRVKVSYNVDKYGNRKDTAVTSRSDCVVYRDAGLLQVTWRSNYYECLQVMRNITSIPTVSAQAAELIELVKSRTLTEDMVRAKILNIPVMDYLFSRAHNAIKLAVNLGSKAESFISKLNMNSEVDRWALGKKFGLFHRHLLEAAFVKQSKSGFLTSKDPDLALALKSCGLNFNPSLIGGKNDLQLTDTYAKIRPTMSAPAVDSVNYLAPTSTTMLGTLSHLSVRKEPVSVRVGDKFQTFGPSTIDPTEAVEESTILDYPGRRDSTFKVSL